MRKKFKMFTYTMFTYLYLINLPKPIVSKTSLFQVIYSNISPYIVVHSDRNATGIIPDIIKFTELFCENYIDKSKFDHVLEYNTKIRSITHINDLLNSNESYGHGELENITEEYAFWFPVLETVDYNSYKNIKKRNLTLYHVKYLEEIVVITSEQRIHLIKKVYIGLSHCSSVAALAGMGSICFALLIWYVEKFSKSKDFSTSFIKGVGTGAWLSVVTMGTVGYGDITPKTCIGRVIAFLWMIVSVVFASVMTATISETVHGVNSLELYNQAVTGLAHTPEENIAKNDYNATFYGVETIEEMIEMLENHTVSYGILNADIASYYQDMFYNANKGDESIEQLVYIYSIHVKIPVEFLVNINVPDVKKYLDCFEDHRKEIVPSILAKYKKHLKFETLHHIGVTKLFKQYPLLSYVSATLLSIIFIGICFEFYSSTKYSRKRKTFATYE